MPVIIVLVVVVQTIKKFHYDDSFQTLERTNRQTDKQTDKQTDRPRCRVDLALRAGSTEKCIDNVGDQALDWRPDLPI